MSIFNSQELQNWMITNLPASWLGISSNQQNAILSGTGTSSGFNASLFPSYSQNEAAQVYSSMPGDVQQSSGVYPVSTGSLISSSIPSFSISSLIILAILFFVGMYIVEELV